MCKHFIEYYMQLIVQNIIKVADIVIIAEIWNFSKFIEAIQWIHNDKYLQLNFPREKILEEIVEHTKLIFV